MADYDWKIGLYKAAKVFLVGGIGYLAADPNSLTALAALVPQPWTPLAAMAIVAGIAALKNWAKTNGYIPGKV